MEGPPSGPGGEDITWPDQVAARGRKASSTCKIKLQTSNLCAACAWHRHGCVGVVQRRLPLAHALGKSRRGALKKGGDQLGDEECGAQGSARLEALLDGPFMLCHVRIVGGEDLLEGKEEVARNTTMVTVILSQFTASPQEWDFYQ